MGALNTFIGKIAATNWNIPALAYNIPIAFVIVFIGVVIGRILGRILDSVLTELDFDSFVRNITGKRYKAKNAVSKTVTYVIFFIFIILAFKFVGIAGYLATVLAAASLVFAAGTMILGINDFIPNALAGTFFLNRRIIAKDNIISIGTIEGKVKAVTRKGVFLETGEGDNIYLPNIYIIKESVRIVKHGSA